MTDATHAALMDATYRHQRRIYDVTRRHFLLGRDRLIAELDPPPAPGCSRSPAARGATST